MKQHDPNPSRSDRLDFLRAEQARIRRSRVQRRNAGLVAAIIVLVGGTAWLVSPSQQPLSPRPTPQQASTTTHSTPEPDQPGGREPGESGFRITRIEDPPLKITSIVRSATPRRVEYMSDVELFIAMRGQGIDAGLMRVDGRTELAFNDEESRRRFERGLDSAE